jgi:hypothetical protein
MLPAECKSMGLIPNLWILRLAIFKIGKWREGTDGADPSVMIPKPLKNIEAK